MEQLGSQETDFHEYLSIFRKPIEKIPVALKSDKKNGYFIWRPIHIFDYTGLFISPSGISELDCATTKTDTAGRSLSIGRESLQVFFLY